MAYKIVNDDSLTSVANAIRVQGGFSATLEFPDGFVSAIQNLSPSPTLQSKSVAFTPAETVQTSSVTADAGYDGLSAVGVTVGAIPSQYVVPSGTYSITSNGIYDIVSFASVDVNVSGGGGGDHDVEDGIIQKTISGAYENSRVMIIGNYLFQSCSSLTTVSFPNATSIGSYAFQGCSRLTTASFPNATNIGNNAFSSCSSLTTASFPNATSIGTYAFASCSSLTTASFPNATSIGSYAFQGCSRLTTASFSSVISFGNQAFRSCSRLTSLYVLASSVATLGTSVFLGTPMSNSTYTGSFGSIYVPASLVDTYKSRANWSVYSARITAYEE